MFDLYLYNTLNRCRERFVPLNPKRIGVYVCGPTVYAPIHIGNARTLLVFDVLVRILKAIFGAEHVQYVRNITDVDDKIVDRAAQQNISAEQLATSMNELFQNHVRDFGLLEPEVQPRVTDNMAEMMSFIHLLIDKGYAYIKDGNVMFKVSKFEQYGQFARQNVEQLKVAARVPIEHYKEQAEDFVLWKSTPEYGWTSPWGYGRPGWHLECSVLSYKYLGEQYDIHGGGQDLIFPHHQNEIAQSQAVFDVEPARYWVHVGMLHLHQQKMSKSHGNIVTLQEALQQHCNGNAALLKLALLLTHYRQPLYFDSARMQEAEDILRKWQHWLNAKLYTRAEMYNLPLTDRAEDVKPSVATNGHAGSIAANMDREVLEALLDDMNTPAAIGVINRCLSGQYLLHHGHRLGKLKASLRYLGFDLLANWTIASGDQQLLKQRQQARDDGDYQQADNLRQQLKQHGIEVEDGHDGCICYPCLDKANL